jgi:hypothetical protein
MGCLPELLQNSNIYGQVLLNFYYGIFVYEEKTVDVFSIMTGAGAIVGLVQVARHAPQDAILEWLDLALLVLFGALVGARLYYVFIHFGYYRAHLLEIPQVWLGGLDWPGAVLGGVTVLLAIAFVKYLSIAEAADRLAHLIPPLSVSMWVGCWASGNDYGLPASLPEPLYTLLPVPLLASLSLLCYYAWLEIRVVRPLPAGRRAGLIGFGLAVNLLGFSFFRIDPYPMWMGFRPDTWAALVFTMMMLSVCLLPSTSLRVDRRIEESKHSLKDC